MIFLYIIDFIAGFISGFVNISQGSLFNSQRVKGITLLITIIVLIILCVLAFTNYSWLHILGLVAVYIVSAQLAAFLLLKNKGR